MRTEEKPFSPRLHVGGLQVRFARVAAPAPTASRSPREVAHATRVCVVLPVSSLGKDLPLM